MPEARKHPKFEVDVNVVAMWFLSSLLKLLQLN
jgi:hypothetical protein